MKKLSALALFLATNLHAETLTLYFYPSPKGIDWTSPTGLVQSGLKNKLTFKKRFIGHVFVEINCPEKKEITSMTAGKFDYLSQLLLGGTGLGILYHSFDGELEDQNETRPELDEYLKNGDVNYASFKINENQCKRISQYANEYRSKKVFKNFGLANRPRQGEGAGSSAYGVSFLDVLNILDQDMKESWGQTINIPHEYAGSPLTDNYVNPFSFYTGDVQWAKESQKHTKLSFWNPDKMHAWVKTKISQKREAYSVESKSKAQGVVFDKSHFPVPAEPIWIQHL